MKLIAEKLSILISGLTIIALASIVFILQPNNINKIESVLYDTLVSWLAPGEPSNLITIVDIDDKSLAQIGQWPWPRHKVAQLLEKVQQMQALSVGIDVLFAEPDRTSLTNLPEDLQASFAQFLSLKHIPSQLFNHDQQLSKVLHNGPFVTGYSFLFAQAAPASHTESSIHPLNILYLHEPGTDQTDILWYQPNDVISNLEIFSEAVEMSGFFNVSPDYDGIIRKVPLLMQYQNKLYPSLSLATLIRALQTQQLILKTAANGMHSLIIDEQQIPIDQQGNIWIHFRNTKESVFPTVSAADILNDQVSQLAFENRIVLLGTSAKGLHDLRTTPYDAIFPGVEIHATMIDNIIRGDFIHRPPWTKLAQLGLILCAGSLSLLLIVWCRAVSSFIWHLALIGLLFYFSWWYLQSYRIYLSTFYPIVVVLLSFSILTVLQYRFKERRLIRETVRHNQQQKIALSNLQQAKSELETLSQDLERQVIERTQSLKTSEQKTRLLLTSVGEGIFGVDQQGLVNFINPAALKMLQYEEDEVLAKNIHSLIHHSHADGSAYHAQDCHMCYTHLKPLNHSQTGINTDDEIIWRKDGSYLIAAYNARPIIEENQVTGAVITFNDISATRAIEKERFEANKKLADSIRYASLIQHSLIPDTQLFHHCFKESFIIWQPKDIVGGDIYLFETLRQQNEFLLMLIDCTGHGVPGAFVTMLVKAIEQEIIAKINETNDEVSPGKILNHFNQRIKSLLNQETDNSISNAGFDGGILYYNKQQQYMSFAGSVTDLYMLDDSKITVIKGNKHSIGYKKSDDNYQFKEHRIALTENLQCYLTTDGYLDQKGGEKGFCLGKKRLQNILSMCDNKSMSEQKEVWLSQLKNYQGSYERNDDVSVIGFKI